MKLSSYVVVHDYGFAPNPFGSALTLATCKPDIRKSAVVGDWIIGTGSVENDREDHLLYAGMISHVLPIATYGSSAEFAHKIPCRSNGRWGMVIPPQSS